jgi:peroxiredoxin
MIEQGEEAPDFELPDQDGRTVKLSDFRGEPVVVYFYPKADTPGCTTQACGVRDHRSVSGRKWGKLFLATELLNALRGHDNV